MSLLAASQARLPRSITTLDMSTLQSSLSVYGTQQGTDLAAGLRIIGNWGAGPRELQVSGQILQDIAKGSCRHERDWRETWQGLTAYFRVSSNQAAQAQSALLLRYFFQREGWEYAFNTAEETLLFLARKKQALGFGGPLSKYKDIPMNPSTSRNPLNHWIESGQLNEGFPKGFFFHRGVRMFLCALGEEADAVDLLIQGAIFEVKGWATLAETSWENLQLAIHRIRAMYFGGRWPQNKEIPGVPAMVRSSKLRELIDGNQSHLDNETVVGQLIHLLIYENFMNYDQALRLVEALRKEPSL